MNGGELNRIFMLLRGISAGDGHVQVCPLCGIRKVEILLPCKAEQKNPGIRRTVGVLKLYANNQ